MVDGDPIEPRAEVARGLVHELAGEGPQILKLSGIIGRDDEPEMMPVVLAAFGEGFAVCLVSGRIKQSALRPIASHPIALEISDVSAERAGRAHLAHDPRFDDGAAGAVVEEPRCGKARGAASPKRAAAPLAAPRETAGLLRGLESLRQERFGTSRARRADAAWTDAKIVVSSHVGLMGCRKLSGDKAFPKVATCTRYGAMFAGSLEFSGSPHPDRPHAPCVLYPALLGRWFRGPNFQANRLSVLAATCDKMQYGSLRWIIQ
jgi:hypothetical protein